MATQTKADDEAQTQTMTDSELITGLQTQMTAEELRRFAAHLENVSRSRGATKSQTSEEIVEQDRGAAARAVSDGDFTVGCSCGLAFDVSHPQTALKEAQRHKSENPTHFPRARDDRDDSRIYG